MNIKNTSIQQLCLDCVQFFGCESFNGLCSVCFKQISSQMKRKKQQQRQQNKLSTPNNISTTIMKVQFIRQVNKVQQILKKLPKYQQKDKKRCYNKNCQKNIGILGNQCKCGYIFCNVHRLPQYHMCQFDNKQNEKKRIQSQLARLQEKINRI